MTSRAAVEEFLSQTTLAIAGVSRNEKKFGSVVMKSLKAKGYRMLPIHPEASELEGERCYRSIGDLPETPGGLVLVVHPEQTELLVKEAHEAGIRRIWMQTGAESDRAIAYCRERGIESIHHECILMFAEPAEFFHRAHRFINKLTGKLPK
ncbi:MAG: CoA-binding protein [Acidobacteriota bacterium]